MVEELGVGPQELAMQSSRTTLPHSERYSDDQVRLCCLFSSVVKFKLTGFCAMFFYNWVTEEMIEETNYPIIRWRKLIGGARGGARWWSSRCSEAGARW